MNSIVDLLAIVVSILALAAATSSAFFLLVLGISEPLYVILSMLLLSMFLLLVYFSFICESESQPLQKEQPRPVVAPVQSLPQPTAAAPVTMVSIACLETREGKIIPVTNVRQVFGRKDFAGLLDPSLLAVISREHFTIFYDFRSGKFFIEDSSSTNGTLLNGDQIRGRGPVELKNGDIVSPAGVIDLVFKV